MTDPDPVLRDALETLLRGDHLDTATARAVMDRIMEGVATPVQIGGILVALRARGETVDELTGMVMSMREHAVHVDLGVDAIDTCGTGGDRSGTFNISTAAALVVAGAGVPVAKHGNRAASSRCGSADVLEALGVAISLPPAGVRRCVEEAGIGFMLAPTYHPAMRHAAATRGELGVRTVFNVIGPLANPARVRRQALGVGDAQLGAMMAGVLHQLGHVRAIVVTGAGGVDELTLDGVARCQRVDAAGVHAFEVDPRDHGFDPAPTDALLGGDAGANALRIRSILAGRPGPDRDVVLLNAAAALVAAEKATDLDDGVAQARESIDSGAAANRLDTLVRVSTAAAAA
jgi:anthranilate phosphoribosyltransferase